MSGHRQRFRVRCPDAEDPFIWRTSEVASRSAAPIMLLIRPSSVAAPVATTIPAP
jgi:hypothetical protein